MTPWLKGNNQPCAACDGTGLGYVVIGAREFEGADGRTWPSAPLHARCPACKGLGFVAKPAASVIAETLRPTDQRAPHPDLTSLSGG